MRRYILEFCVEGGYRLYEHDEAARPPNWTLAMFYDLDGEDALARAKLAYPELEIEEKL